MPKQFQICDCGKYEEDSCITDDMGEPKGQCICGAKWYEHRLDVLPEDERASAASIQKEAGV